MLFFVTAVAHAQDVPDRFDGNLFRPSPDAPTTLWTEQTTGGDDGAVSTRAYAHYANSPVRTQGDDGTERLVSQQLGFDLLGSLRFDGLRVGAHLPLYLMAAGEGESDQPGLGDLAVDVKGTVVDRTKAPVGLAFLGRLVLPTASVNVPLGSTGIGYEAVAIVDQRIDPLTLAGNIGISSVPRAQVGDVVWDDGIFGRLAAALELRQALGASVEWSARTNWAPSENPAGTASELLFGGYGGLGGDFAIRGGVSIGLSRSPGSPVARLVAGLSWEPDTRKDRDVDGLTDHDDWCPSEPEDPDGFEDSDGCPDDAVAARFDVRGPDGQRIDARITLDGAEHQVLEPGDPVFQAHPGDYAVTVSADGYTPWTGTVRLPATQGYTVDVPLNPAVGS